MTVTNLLQRKSILAAGLVLLAGASGLFGQTVAQPALVLPTGQLAFAYQTGRAVPPPQTVRIYSGPENVTFRATASTSAGGGWLFVCTDCTSAANNVTDLTGNTGSGQNLTVSVSPAGLLPSPTPYQGKVTITSGSSTVELAISLSVTSTAQLTIAPGSLPLQTAEMGSLPQYPINVGSSDGTQLQYTASVENPTPNTGWLGVSPAFGVTGATATIAINTAAIPVGTGRVWGSVRFAVFGSPNQVVSVPITVALTPGAQVQVTPGTLNFAYQRGFASPGAKPVTVTSSTSTALTYSVAPAAGQNYFTLSTTGAPSDLTTLTGLTTPAGFYIQPNINVLGATPALGTYETVYNVTATNGSTQAITARLQVTNQTLLTSSVDSVNFAYTLGGPSITPATINIGSTGAPLSFTTARILAANTPAFFDISAPNPFSSNAVQIVPDMNVVRSLPAGTYRGTAQFNWTGAPAPLEVAVVLTVSGSAQITASTPPAFEGPLGISPGERTVVVSSTDPNVQQNFSVTVDYGTTTGPRDWLVATPTNGTTGSATTGAIRLSVDVTRITAPGSYSTTLVIRPTSVANGAPVFLPIQYIVSPGSTGISASPSPVVATQTGITPPPDGTITLSSQVATSYSARVDAGSDPQFVSTVAQATSSIPGTLVIRFDRSSGLAPRTEPYVNEIVISPTAPGLSALRIPVRLTVVAGSTLQASPQALSFAFTSGGANPASQTITLTASAAPVTFTAAATTDQGSWLSVTPTSGTTGTNGTLTVSVNPAGLTAGTYTGRVNVTPTSGGSATPLPITVTLTVTTANPPNSLQVSNNASGISRGVSPGQFITIKGRNMAPGVAFVFSTVPAPTTLGEVRVLFDGVPAPVLYAGPSGDRTSDQINAIVPYGISGRASTNMVVEFRGVTSAPVPLTVRDTEPGLFTANSAGFGPASLLNQDNSYNTQTNPAVAGNIVQIYGTGEGLIAPNPGEGRVVPATAPFPSLLNGPVQVRIGGRVANVVYAGPAPGLLAGVFQINAVVPTDLAVTTATQTSLDVQIGNTSSQPGVTFWVRGQQ